MKKAVSYRRVSTASQVEKYGLDVQKDCIEKYCKDNDIDLVTVDGDDFHDDGVSGAMEGAHEDLSYRDGLISMFDYLAENPDVKYVVVLQTSRLWRDDMSRVFITHELKKLGVDVISVNEQEFTLYSDDPSKSFINAILAAIDVYERQSINLKLARGRRAKLNKERMKPGGVLAFGYEMSRDGKVVINEAAADIIRGIFSMRRNGVSMQHIADYLNDNGIESSTCKKWGKSSISLILNNDYYIGVVSYGEKLRGVHEPIISQETFRAIHPDYDFSVLDK